MTWKIQICDIKWLTHWFFIVLPPLHALTEFVFWKISIFSHCSQTFPFYQNSVAKLINKKKQEEIHFWIWLINHIESGSSSLYQQLTPTTWRGQPKVRITSPLPQKATGRLDRLDMFFRCLLEHLSQQQMPKWEWQTVPCYGLWKRARGVWLWSRTS